MISDGGNVTENETSTRPGVDSDSGDRMWVGAVSTVNRRTGDIRNLKYRDLSLVVSDFGPPKCLVIGGKCFVDGTRSDTILEI